MKTIILAARICINSDDEMEKVFTVDVEDNTTLDTTWTYTMAGKVADHYIEAGQICVSGIEILDVAPKNTTPIPLT